MFLLEVMSTWFVLLLKQCPQHAEWIWKHSFVFTVTPTVSLRKRSFSLFKPEEFENAGFSLLHGLKTFWKVSFSETRWHHNKQAISLTECFSAQLQDDRWEFPWRGVDAKQLMRFQSVNSVFKFLGQSVDEAEIVTNTYRCYRKCV